MTLRLLLSWFGSDRRGFCSGTFFLITLVLLTYAGGIQASLSLGPDGVFPGLSDVFLYAFSHDEPASLLLSLALLLLLGPAQERRWGTAAFLALSLLTAAALPAVYTVLLCAFGAEASRIGGYFANQLALFTAQCRQMTQRRFLRMPVWLLPWFLLLLGLLLLPGTPALLNFCAIIIGHNYHQSAIVMLQELEEASIMKFLPRSSYVATSSKFRLPTYNVSPRSTSLPQRMSTEQVAPCPVADRSVSNHRTWTEPSPAWSCQETAPLSEAEMLDEQMLRAGILASLQDTPEEVDAKVEVPKSSISSLRLQQLEKMGFPTEKAVVALAASKQLDGAISLLVDGRVGEQAVVVAKEKSSKPKQSS